MPRRSRELSQAEGDDPLNADQQENDNDFPSFKLLSRVAKLSKKLGLTKETPPTGRKTISEAAVDSAEGRNMYKDVQRLEKALKRPIFSRTPGRGLEVSPEQKQLLVRIEQLVEQAEELKRGEPLQICFKVATSPLLNLRVVGPLAQEAFRDRNASEASNPDPKQSRPGSGPMPKVQTMVDSPFALANKANGNNDLDFIITFAPLGYRFDPEPIFSVMATRCILVGRSHNVSPRARKFVEEFRERIEKKGEFSYGMLRGLSVASLADDHRIPDFPLSDISEYAERILVTNSTLESHALVRGGLADATFSHWDVLSENDIKMCDVIDLKKVSTPGLYATRLCLIAGKRRRGTDDEIEALSHLRQAFTMYFAKVQERYNEAARLKSLLENFKYSYHTSYHYNQSGLPERTWLRGRLNYKISVPHVTSDVAFLVGGTHRFEVPGMPGEKSPPLAFFGRAVILDKQSRGSEADSGESYLCRVSFFEKESASFHIVFSEDELTGKDYLFGTWTGTPSYMRSQKVQIAGCVIFHRHNNVPLEELNKIVSDKLVETTHGFVEKANPLNPWEPALKLSDKPWTD